MEKKKIDIYSIIGYLLIFGIVMWMMYKTPAPVNQDKNKDAEKEQTLTSNKAEKDTPLTLGSDSTRTKTVADTLNKEVKKFKVTETEVSTDVFDLKFLNKGGYLSEINLKNFVRFDSLPIYIIKDKNSALNLTFSTNDDRTIDTKDKFFEPTVTKNNNKTVVSMRYEISKTEYVEYLYTFKPNDYMFNFSIKSKGLKNIINTSRDIAINWDLKARRQAKSISYESRYTDLHYAFEGNKDDYLGQSEDEETVEEVNWIGYKQHFFSSILVPDSPFKTVNLKSKNLVEDEEIDTVYTKRYEAKIPLQLSSQGEFNENMKFYVGPTDFKTLEKYDDNLDEIVPLGWGIFGWINRYLFIPLFGFLSRFLAPGLAIVVMTVMIKILLSFVQYKQFLSQAKMKILKPELDAIRKKYKDNKLKAQQETMALQNRAGASPLSGCLPGLMQIPVFYALFQFFPSAFNLRQKSFLWADDLSSYDAIYEFPGGFTIPFYGNHVSLFPLLAAIAIFFYMKMTTGQNTAMQQPAQEGMPDMSKMMKYMIYFSPLLMLFFFNNYASGLSLYYFISNTISIGIMLVIKNYIIDENKVLAKIQAKKSKPKKENRFQRKMKEMMEQAEKQKQLQQKRKK